jgi:hypothetical protein
LKTKKKLNKLRANSYQYRTLTNHPIHREMQDLSNRYREEILQAKRQHWASYLEEMDADEIWTANKYLQDPTGDGRSPCIPMLKTKEANRPEKKVNDNQGKANLFAETFPPPSIMSNVLQ